MKMRKKIGSCAEWLFLTKDFSLCINVRFTYRLHPSHTSRWLKIRSAQNSRKLDKICLRKESYTIYLYVSVVITSMYVYKSPISYIVHTQIIGIMYFFRSFFEGHT